MTLTLGVDVGGTKIAAGVVDQDGRVLAEARVKSPARDIDAMTGAIAEVALRLSAEVEGVTAVGVGLAGFIDADRSRVLVAPNLAWRDQDLRSVLESRVGLPVVIENDGNAAAWGEFRFGAGADVDDTLMVTVGTGVGGGIVLDGSLYRGAHGVAAELGHLRVVPDGVPCGCGARGCLEQYGSGTALVRRVRADAEAGVPEAVALAAEAAPKRINGPQITAAAQRGDGYAVAALGEVGRWLGEGIASLVTVLDPAVVVVGGGVAEAGDLLLGPLRVAYEATMPGRHNRPSAEIRVATLGNAAGKIGAADLARLR